ncbi:prolyl-tRNA synthetase associated domain-containing protein [Adlercreutzia agrestimuris]|uniref:prolyl-tRNA synthetase associated domain-containing protein n=1 Tax=Adlercreutzia agrestimuris TaxID=2941324 RepID=UPI00203BF211|nr:prolyl-tRNA synthetase associated domain-containing protein [Adlercreutzia agrestimuris]
MADVMGKQEVVALLNERGVAFDMVEHEAVYTMEGMDELQLPFAQEVVKNLFLRDDKKRNYYLVVMPEDKPANIKELRATLEARPLRFASEEDLAKYLGVIAGAVTPFGALNDPEGIVQVVFDEDLRSYSGLGVHPNDNTATLHVPLDAILAIYDEREIPYRFIPMSA